MTLNLHTLVNALLETLNDKDEGVIDAASASLRTLGMHKPEHFMVTVHSFLSQGAKLTAKHRAQVLKILKVICTEKIDTVTQNTVELIVNLVTQEMTLAKDDADMPASLVLVSISRKYCSIVMDSILQKFQPGLPLCPSIVYTLGEVAVTNHADFVCHLPEILSRALPIMNSIKTDPLKLTFTIAIGKFADSLLENLLDQCSLDDSLRLSLEQQFAGIYEFMSHSWLTTKDQKLRCSLVRTLSTVAHFLPAENLQDEGGKLIHTALSMYSRSNDLVLLTQGICQLLHAFRQSDCSLRDPTMDEIWSAIISHMTSEFEANNVQQMKTQSEILRVFGLCAQMQEERLLNFLFQRINTSSEKVKCDSFYVLKHLLNSSKSCFSRKGTPNSGSTKAISCNGMLHTCKMRKSLSLLIVALLDNELMEIEMGDLLVAFMVRQLLSIDEPMPHKPICAESFAGTVTVPTLSSHFAQSIFYLVCNVPKRNALFWPALFEYLCDVKYTDCVIEVCKSLVVIAHRLSASNRLTIVYRGNERLPGVHQIFARLFVLLGLPCSQQPELSNQALLLLKEMSSFFYPNLGVQWKSDLLALEQIISGTEAWTTDHWKDALVTFLTKSLDYIDNDEWLASLAAAFGKHLILYNSYPGGKRLCMICLGVTLSKVKSHTFVVDHLDLLFRNVVYASDSDRTGCAEAVGFCSQGHIDIVLTKLEDFAKREYVKKSAGIFNLLKEALPMKTEKDHGISSVRSTVMLCYGYVALHCPANVFISKLENVILRYLITYFDSTEDETFLRCMLITIKQIAMAVYPFRSSYKFPFRKNLFAYVSESVATERPHIATNDLRLQAVEACLELTKLEPKLSETEIWSLGTTFANCIYPLEQVRDEAANKNLVNSCLSVFNGWLLENLDREMNVEQLAVLIKVLRGWFSSSTVVHRQRALESSKLLFIHFYENVEVVLGHAIPFPAFGYMLARFAPRAWDDDCIVRRTAMSCLYWLLEIASLHRGHGKGYCDSVIEVAKGACDQIETNNNELLVDLLSKICEVIDQRLPASNMQQYISVLTEMLTDEQETVSQAAAVLLKSTLASRGHMLAAEVGYVSVSSLTDSNATEATTLVNTLVEKFKSGKLCLQTYAETLQAFFEFSRHHIAVVIRCLLGAEIPLSQAVCDCWRILVRDPMIFTNIIDHLLKMANVEGQLKQNDANSPTLVSMAPIASTAALREVIQGVESVDLLLSYFSQIYVTLVFQCGALVDCSVVNTFGLSKDFLKHNRLCAPSIAAIRALLMRSRLEDVVFAVEESKSWKDFEDVAHFPDAVTEMAKAIAKCCPQMVQPIVSKLRDSVDSASDSSRVVVAATLAAFMKHCSGQNEDLVESIVNGLLSGLVDSQLAVRKVSVRGLGNVAHAEEEIFARYSNSALAAMMAGLEDVCDFKDEIVFEAMQGLSKLASRASKEQIERLLVNVILRIRPCFEKESGAVRSVAFNLLGSLCRFGTEQSFYDQIHHCLVPVLLHVYDEVEEVRTAASFSLSEFSKVINDAKFAEVAEKASQVTNELSYPVFLKEFATVLVSFTQNLDMYALYGSNYCKSTSARIRCNAALFIGYFLGTIPADLRNSISKGLILTGLIAMLKEPEVEVRRCAAQAMAYLYYF
ncbi:hypothetical protein M514_13667 [Trichuris suis]|uniref:HEAT repeat protein n=1 Tax=Trichuris suis TaxID=68888 RepID=A0A085N8E1_9BILA|nr:hypothetical protein M514_13667 [Trichuris suis]